MKDFCILAAASLVLTACGSSSTTVPLSQGNLVTFPAAGGAASGALAASDVAGLGTAFQTLFDALDDGSVDLTSQTLSGTANFNGYIGVQGENENDGVIGNLTISANFDTNTVTADATDFAEFDFTDQANPVAVSTIGVEGGTLTGTGAITGTGFTSTLDGSVTINSNSFVLDGLMDGAFVDNGSTLATVGVVSGTLAGDPIENGVFYAE